MPPGIIISAITGFLFPVVAAAVVYAVVAAAVVAAAVVAGAVVAADVVSLLVPVPVVVEVVAVVAGVKPPH